VDNELEIVRVLPYFQAEIMVQEDPNKLEKTMAWSRKKQIQVLCILAT